MDKFFNPHSIAIVGASDQKGKIGNILLENLKLSNFKGTIYPINPKHKDLAGVKCYSTVLDIEDPVDLAIIAIPATFVPKAIQECAWKSQPIKNIIVISAGFSESGEEGKKLEEEIQALAQEYELKIVGPNCLGCVNAKDGLNLSFSKNNFPVGKIGLIMQSGAFTTALFDLAAGENFGVSLVATLGNKAVLDETDFLQYFETDESTKIVAMYLEDIKRGKEFCEAVRKISETKPVLVLKAGNSKKSQAAILSHTGAMAGESDVTKEALIESGALYFENLIDFVGAIKILNGFQKPQNKNVVIITNAGGPGVITTDLIEKNQHLNMLEFSNRQEEFLKEVLPQASSTHNPIDVLGDADSKRYGEVLERLAEMKDVGSVLAIVTPQAQTDIEAICNVFVQANKKSKFPIIPVVIGSQANEMAKRVLSQDELANFVFPSNAVNSIENYYQLTKNIIVERKNESSTTNKNRQKKAEKIFDTPTAEGRDVFFYEEARDLVSLYNINAIESYRIQDKKDLDSLGGIVYPVVLKIDSSKVLHKNAEGGLVLDIKDQSQLEKSYNELKESFRDESFIVQSQIKPGIEIILGIKKDPNFGHVLMIGLGGIMTEIFDRKLLWILPASESSIQERIENSFLKKVFEKQKIEVGILVEQALKIAQIAIENPWIKELDVNPMIFYPDADPIAVDVKVISSTNY